MNIIEILEELLYPNVIAVILAITALVTSRKGVKSPLRVTGIINLLFAVLMVMVVLQLFNTLSDGINVGWIYVPKYITTSIHNFFTVLYPGLCCIFVYEYTFVRGKSKRIWALLVSPAFVWAAALIINIWTGWIFTIDENTIYHRGPLVYFTFILPLFSVVVGTIISYAGFQGNKSFLRFPIWTFALPAIGGVVAQALFEGINTIHLGLAVGFCGACVSLQKDKLYIDTLTGLYNRSYLFYIFSKIEKKRKRGQVGAIMLDINYLKHINEEFGHQVGDIALVDAALILERSLEKGGAIVRFAGDEFIIVIRHNNIKEALADTLERIKINTDIFNNTETNQYKLNFAIGSSVMLEGEDPDDFLARIDAEMYKDKENIKLNAISIRRRA